MTRKEEIMLEEILENAIDHDHKNEVSLSLHFFFAANYKLKVVEGYSEKESMNIITEFIKTNEYYMLEMEL